jgi:phosphate uptake regulator
MDKQSFSGDVRRLQRTGQSTFIVSLPKNWVEEMNLGKGDLVTILRHGDQSLLLSPRDIRKSTENLEVILQVSSSENPNSIIRKLVALYFSGFRIIKITDNLITPEQRDAIKGFVRRKFVGTEIVTESRSEIALHVLLSYAELPIDTAMRRMSLLATSMHQDVIVALKELNYKLANQVSKMDDEIDRFNFYIIRQLNATLQRINPPGEMGLESLSECLGYRLITKAVERIADHAARIADNVQLIKEPIDQEIYEKIDEMSIFSTSMFEASIASLFKRDVGLADEVVQRKTVVERHESELIRFIFTHEQSVDTVSSLRLIVESLKRVSDYSSDIAETVIDMMVPGSIQVTIQPNISV